ncbi:RHS repeat-associated core domain-containing protein [Massilia sp. YMA4]|uniref:RHS repeat-associated core domain-containing protein n=1 Tax=Massilia sp. YMA4 TaxID=1593482 RepID=UPI000DD13D23|nr:RHS repeat-associated core domain-containing protein [Massilia sp. YMA4]AXA90566.1 hypothetical protein DPH57_04885 [Massilia sp. YMA4]
MQTTLPDGRVLNNLYYGSGHLHQINLDGELITDIERDWAHRMVSRTQGALVSQFQYDPVGRLLSQSAVPPTAGEGAAPVIARKYEYDEVGNLVSIDDQRNGVTRYSYDPIGRILSAVQPTLTERFAFDPAHNLLDTTVASVGRVEGNRIRVYEDKRYDYDEHGNVVEKLIGKHTRMRFEWNAAHQMVKSIVARNSSDTAQTVRYAYDPFGLRIAKKDAFGVTRFVWDGNRLLCEQRGRHARTYVYGGDEFVPMARVDSVSDVNNATYQSKLGHIHTDHLGTPRELTNCDGQILWAVSCRVWGNTIRVADVQEQATASPLAEPSPLIDVQPIRFQGQCYDPETGLHYSRFRYYDPDLGRFVSIDPIGLAGGANTYTYPLNPTKSVDPMGLSPCNGDNAPTGKNTGTVWDAIQPAGPMHPGSVIPQKFELTLEGGGKVWVDGNATKHIAEYAAAKAVNATPEAVRLASQVQLESLGSAVNAAVQNGITYRQMMNVNNWELIFAPPKSAEQFPALYHAIYKAK